MNMANSFGIMKKGIDMDTLRRFKLVVWLFTGVLVCLTGAIRAEETRTQESYDEVLRECVLKPPSTVVWDQYFDVKAGLSGASWVTGFMGPLMLAGGERPIEAFSDANAVPFLINVALKGPDWTDERLLKDKGGILPHIARCIAVMTLGATKDPRGLEPLLQVLNDGDYMQGGAEITYPDKDKYSIRGCAAQALELMENPGAAEALMAIVKKKDESNSLRLGCLRALTFTRDMRALPLIFKYWERLGGGARISPRLDFMLMASPGVDIGRDRKFFAKKLPELGKVDSVLVIWRHWLKKMKKEAPKDFAKKFGEWEKWKDNHPATPVAQHLYSVRISEYGVATFPYMVEGIRAGYADLAELVSWRTKGEIKKDASREEVLAWWEKNKQRWTIPFDKIEDPNQPTGTP